MTRITFIVLTWNSSKFILRCLASILEISSLDVRVYVVDNGSSDRTQDLVLGFDDPRVILIPQGSNLGTTRSRNIALRRIEDDGYVCILDSDTEVNEAAVKKMVSYLQADPTIGLIGPIMANSKGAVQLSGRNLPTLSIKLKKACPLSFVQRAAAREEVPGSPIVDGLQDVPYLLSACWVLPKKTINEVGLLDEAIFYAPEDVDYCVRVWEAGYRCVLCHDAQIVHEYQRLSKRKLVSKMNWEHIKGLAYYFQKHGYLFDSSKVVRTEQ